MPWNGPPNRVVTATCDGCGCDIERRDCEVNRPTFLWCEECKPERKRQYDRESYARRKHIKNKRRKEKRDH